MSATERRTPPAAAADAPIPQERADVLIGASREAGRAAADAWTIWLAARQDMAAQQFGLLGRLMDRALPARDAAEASHGPEPDPARSIRLARQGCQRMIQGVRAANDAASGLVFRYRPAAPPIISRSSCPQAADASRMAATFRTAHAMRGVLRYNNNKSDPGRT